MNFALERTLPNAQPIYVDENNLYLLREDRIFRSDHDLGLMSPFARLRGKRAAQRRIAPRLARRIFRLIVRAAVACEGFLYLAIKDEIYRIDLSTGEAELDFVASKGLTLFNLSVVVGADGEPKVCFGEYRANPDRAPVRVWSRSRATAPDWRSIDLFPAGEIEHIHQIRQIAGGGVAILTGDFDDAASMWLCAADFTGLRRWSPPGQTYRACWLWETPDGDRWWATDSQFERNRLMTADAGLPIATAREVMGLPGSCIYSAVGARHMAFSTAVEPGARSANRLKNWLTREPGPAITGNESVIYTLADGRVAEILRARKDVWPLRLAQFGAFQFPAGRLPETRLYAYGVAVDGYDGMCLSFRRR